MTRPGGLSVEVTLRHEHGRWRAIGDGIDVAHADLAGLDRLIEDAVVAAGKSPAPHRVHVRFDIDRLPVWMRQYHAHYFNYVLKLNHGAAA